MLSSMYELMLSTIGEFRWQFNAESVTAVSSMHMVYCETMNVSVPTYRTCLLDNVIPCHCATSMHGYQFPHSV